MDNKHYEAEMLILSKKQSKKYWERVTAEQSNTNPDIPLAPQRDESLDPAERPTYP
jgi:hypothetical protein